MLYVGIDEAGYGPVLGPLCVGFAALDVPAPPEPGHAPDLWKLLAPIVTRKPSRPGAAAQTIAVDDSKKLKGSNSLKTRHPLANLERGVLAFAHASALHAAETQHNAEPSPPNVSCDDDLFSRLGVSIPDPEWYTGAPVSLPLATTPDHQRLLNVALAAACDRAVVRVLDLRSHAMTEPVFNQRLRSAPATWGDAFATNFTTDSFSRSTGEDSARSSKAAVSFSIISAFLHRVWKSAAALHHPPGEMPRVVIDRQGGRAAYTPVLALAFPDARIETLGESPARSVYELHGTGDSTGRAVRVSFQTEAESQHFPVALASMTAKLTRELAMHRFNRYWCTRIAELKPTAGYATDGERWLGDVRPHITRDELTLLRRLA